MLVKALVARAARRAETSQRACTQLQLCVVIRKDYCMSSPSRTNFVVLDNFILIINMEFFIRDIQRTNIPPLGIPLISDLF